MNDLTNTEGKKIHPSREMVEASRALEETTKRFYKADRGLREQEHDAEEITAASHEYLEARREHQAVIKECERLGL